MKAKIYIGLILFFPWLSQVCGQGMIIQPGALVEVEGGSKVIITGSSRLTIKSTSAGTGSLIVDNTMGSSVTVPTGNSIVERYLAPDKWHYISSPITSALSGIFMADYLMTSDQTTSTGWGPYIVSVTESLAVMRGYSVWKPASNSSWQEVFSGNLNNGDLSINVGNVGGTWAGWSLVGNPYPCAIDLSSGGVTWNNVEHTAWFWNGDAGNYQAWPSNGIGSGIYNGGTHLSFVPAMQGFFVHSTSGTASLSFTNAVRVHDTEPFLKSSQNPLLVIKVTGNANSYFDEISIQFNPDATAGYDPGYDAYKLSGLNEAPQLYTQIQDIEVTCNSLPFSKADMTVPMGFRCGISGNYTLMAESLESIDPGTAVFLEDLKLDQTQNLRSTPDYNFSYDPADHSNRFLLHFNNTNAVAIREQQNADPLQIYSFENSIYIRKTGTSPLSGKMSVYDPLGKELYTNNLTDNMLSRFEMNLSTGYYVVKVTTEDNFYTQKVVIRY